jgi:hypothetical protein
MDDLLHSPDAMSQVLNEDFVLCFLFSTHATSSFSITLSKRSSNY